MHVGEVSVDYYADVCDRYAWIGYFLGQSELTYIASISRQGIPVAVVYKLVSYAIVCQNDALSGIYASSTLL